MLCHHCSLESVLRESKEFVLKYTQRTFFRGMTRLAFRNNYASELGSLNNKLTECAMAFHLSFDIDTASRRVQDIKVFEISQILLNIVFRMRKIHLLY